jgi:CheY-like chemotaxis protein
MAKEIIWLDNDAAFVEPYVQQLNDEGYKVSVVETVTEAEEALGGHRYDLLILDAMIPTKNEEEEKRFPPDETNRGLNMGLAFYRRWRGPLRDSETRVLALTVRIDEAIQREFMNLGLPPEGFTRKTRVKRVQDVSQKVRALIGDP